MKKYSILWIVLIIFFSQACEILDVDPERIFLIKKGSHYSTHAIEMLESDVLSFTAEFDESAIYTTRDPIQQFSTNKLMGFSDCNCHHHENSARFGWQWLDGQLEIWAYTYVYGENIEAFVGVVPINEPKEYYIQITDETYIFKLEGFPAVEMERGKKCDIGVYYMLWPYFGGQETAPHDISIKVVFKSR